MKGDGTMFGRRAALMMMAAALWSPVCRGEEDRARRLFEDAIAAMGGDANLGVKDMVSEGRYFQFDR